jgi:hypothetical protein
MRSESTPTRSQVYWTEKKSSNWTTANLQCPAKMTLEPTSNKMVALNVINQRGYQPAEACESVAAISSGIYVVQEGPALVQINWLGQATIGGYACSRSQSYLSLCLCTILISLCERCKV